MTVRFKIALTIFITGLITAIGVISTVALAFQRFEDESTFERANLFLGRLVGLYDNIFELHRREPEEFEIFLRNLVLLEPNSRLYLLDAEGRVLAGTGPMPEPDFRVSLGPVEEAIDVFEARQSGRPLPMGMPYVKGDNPERPGIETVIAAQPLRLQQIRPDGPIAGYLYLVCHKPLLPTGRAALFGSSLVEPALAAIAAVVLLATLLAAWIVATVTRPLRELSAEAAAVTRDGLTSAEGRVMPPSLAQVAHIDVGPVAAAGGDEFAQLRHGFHTMLATLRTQWDALRRLDHFRREGVSNLSHDLRSPLTATVACLETLEQRWSSERNTPPRDEEERRLLEVALRNTRNTARLVQALGELAQLDEPEFKLKTEPVDLGELLDDISLRFINRAEQQGVQLLTRHAPDAGGHADLPVAAVDIELFERAVANLVDNALKFCPPGARIELQAGVDRAARQVTVGIVDSGRGIAAADLPHLFDRFYQARQSVAPATGEGGKGLGLAIVKRIVELHLGELTISSEPGRGTEVGIRLPLATA